MKKILTLALLTSTLTQAQSIAKPETSGDIKTHPYEELIKNPEHHQKLIKHLWKEILPKTKKIPTYKELGPLPNIFPEKPTKDTKLTPRILTTGKHKMPLVVLNKGPKTEKSFPLYICLHGGGQNPNAKGPHTWPVNTREWQTQVALAATRYPKSGIFVIPRMADDRLGRWYHDLNIEAFDNIIKHAIAHWNVDPNRIYLLGISEGGYGTDKVLPYMSDRFAAGNSMAAGSLVKIGDQSTAENLRDTPIRTDIGGNDTMFNRIGLAKELHTVLDKYETATPGHYTHKLNIHPGKGHGGWDYGLGPVWLPQFTRNPNPKTIIWNTAPADKNYRTRNLWLGYTAEKPTTNRFQATIQKETQTITIKADSINKQGTLTPLKTGTLHLYLNDTLLDLDKPITITLNGKTQKITPTLTVASIKKNLTETGDPNLAAPTTINLPLKNE